MAIIYDQTLTCWTAGPGWQLGPCSDVSTRHVLGGRNNMSSNIPSIAYADRVFCVIATRRHYAPYFSQNFRSWSFYSRSRTFLDVFSSSGLWSMLSIRIQMVSCEKRLQNLDWSVEEYSMTTKFGDIFSISLLMRSNSMLPRCLSCAYLVSFQCNVATRNGDNRTVELLSDVCKTWSLDRCWMAWALTAARACQTDWRTDSKLNAANFFWQQACLMWAQPASWLCLFGPHSSSVPKFCQRPRWHLGNWLLTASLLRGTLEILFFSTRQCFLGTSIYNSITINTSHSYNVDGWEGLTSEEDVRC